MAKKFKKHMMYGNGKEKMANNHKEHLKLKAKGWGHTKPKDSPLDLNQTLVAGAGVSNYQKGGQMNTNAGEWRGDLITGPVMNAMLSDKLTEKEWSEKNNSTKDKVSTNKDQENKDQENKDQENKDQNVNLKGNAKQKKGKKYSVRNAKRNVLQRLFSKNKSKNKFVNDPAARRSIGIEMQNHIKSGGTKQDEKYKELEQERNARFYRVKRPGLFNDETMTKSEFDKIIADEGLIRNSNSKNYEGDYYSPMKLNSRERVIRKSSKRTNSAFTYKERLNDDTPMYQVSDVNKVKNRISTLLPEAQVEGNVFDLMEITQPFDTKKEISSMNLIGDEKPPQLLGPSAVSAISDFMVMQKDQLYNAKMGAGSAIEQESIINNVRSLSVNMNKIGPWISENIESIDKGDESKGSSVANTYLRDLVLTKKTDEQGIPLTTMMVDNNNDLAIKFRDTKGVYNLESIKENIFPKAFETFELVSKAMNTVMGEAISGLPFNEAGARALVNNALKTQEQILSSIHDEESPLFQFLNDFADSHPNVNMDFFHIDSPNFNIEDLKPIIKDYAIKKLRSQHALYSKAKQNTNTLSSEEIIKKFGQVKKTQAQVAQEIVKKYSK